MPTGSVGNRPPIITFKRDTGNKKEDEQVILPTIAPLDKPFGEDDPDAIKLEMPVPEPNSQQSDSGTMETGVLQAETDQSSSKANRPEVVVETVDEEHKAGEKESDEL